MPDILIIGGGVIGLSLAWRLAQRGQRVQVIDRGEPGREASWAGAGIIPAAVQRPDQHPYERLRGLACGLHERWAAELCELTGIDNGFRQCGAIHIARTPGEAAALAAWADHEREQGIVVEMLTCSQLLDLEPGLALPRPLAAALLPGEAQLRNPRHLQALRRACEISGVTISCGIEVFGATTQGDCLTSLETSSGSLRASRFCFTAGAWTGAILQRLGVLAGILPIRGQMVLFRGERPPIRRIINEGSRYLVPRDDGYVLAGSTEEEVGFDKSTTDEAIADLTNFARQLVPALVDATIERTWAGLRPGSFDGLPYLGPLPRLKNAYVAAGHFRSGIYMSTATALLMTQLLCGEPTTLDLAPFRLSR
jgi:glycine oxidase